VPICTLPVTNSKIYIINSPLLIQSALRSKNLSYDPFIHDSIEKLFDSQVRMQALRALGSPEKLDFMSQFNREMHGSMLGEHLHKMNQIALSDIAASINEYLRKDKTFFDIAPPIPCGFISCALILLVHFRTRPLPLLLSRHFE
jgi:hypothetical protein